MPQKFAGVEKLKASQPSTLGHALNVVNEFISEVDLAVLPAIVKGPTARAPVTSVSQKELVITGLWIPFVMFPTNPYLERRVSSTVRVPAE